MHQRSALVVNRVHVQPSQDVEPYQEIFGGNVQFVEQLSQRPLELSSFIRVKDNEY